MEKKIDKSLKCSDDKKLAIKNLVFSKLNLVPTEHREVTLMEFKTSVKSTGSADDKLEH